MYQSSYHTSVSETIRQASAPLAEPQTVLGKKDVLRYAGICPIAEIETNRFFTLKLLKSDNRLLRYGQKTNFNMAAVGLLAF